VQALPGRSGAGVLAGRVGDRDGGEQPAGGTASTHRPDAEE
jgi:hypothetical protein